MTLDGGVSDGLMHGAIALDLCIAPSHRFDRRLAQASGEFSLVPSAASRQVSGLFGVPSSMTLTQL